MDTFDEYIEGIDVDEHRDRVIEILTWVEKNFPNLDTRVAWNQPMFTDHGTFIIGFSVAKNHISIAPEGKVMEQFEEKLKLAEYSFGKKMFRIKFDQDVDFDLLKEIIEFNIEDKKECTTFWAK
ncbi:iron chaperone [Companilactobacillus baiquanensis]|uniref:Iron chaperone n=1 Tax=Companilactobacillus baiquanensis TaxID=2486005 RepID=A0ABW1UVS4_9LACO|nr:iron chaperone [Companilactobacillus baiquanensis]